MSKIFFNLKCGYYVNFFFLVSAVIGLPTVKRPAQSYLLATVSDLIEKMSSRDKEDTLIVIFIAEVEYFLIRIS